MKAQWGDLQEVSLTKEVEPTQGQAGTACPLGLEVQKPEQQEDLGSPCFPFYQDHEEGRRVILI
jgi:hypothetical protein